MDELLSAHLNYPAVSGPCHLRDTHGMMRDMYFIKRRGLFRACLAVRPVSAQHICRTVLELRLSPRQEDAYPMGKYLPLPTTALHRLGLLTNNLSD